MSSKNLQTEYTPEIKRRLKEHAEDGSEILGDTDIEAYVKNAVEEVYSKDRPDERVSDITGDGGFDYTINTTNFPGWRQDFSRIDSVEYPLDTGEPDDNTLEDWEWRTVQTASTTWVLRFATAQPSSSETIRARYTAPYVFSDDAVDIPDSDFSAVCALAASLALGTVASYYTAKRRSTPDAAGRVDNANKARDAVSLADTYRGIYNEHMGISKDGGPVPAFGTKEFDTFYEGGSERLTHPRRHT